MNLGNGTGIAADSGGCKVSRCFAVNNQNDGIHASNLPDGPCVEDSQITGNSGSGAVLQGGGIYRISNTLIANNRGQGIRSLGPLSVNNCVITNNIQYAISASAYDDVSLMVSDCLIEGNGSEWQIDSLYGVSMTNTIIRNSRGGYPGMALRTQNGTSFMKGCAFYNNAGGALSLGGVHATIANCVIRDNGSVGPGLSDSGGIFL